MDPHDARPPTRTGPVAWFERISLLAGDFGKIGSAALVPAVVIAALVPALVDHLSHPGRLLYVAGVRTFPLTVTIAVIWISTSIWNTSKRLNWFWLIAIWCFSIFVSIRLAVHFGCDNCGSFIDIQQETRAWLPEFARQPGLSPIALLISAGVYFFGIFGVKLFLASLVCGSFLGLAGIYLLRPGGPLDRSKNGE